MLDCKIELFGVASGSFYLGNVTVLACIAPASKFPAIEKLCNDVTVPGSVIEVGVWRGGMAVHLYNIMQQRKLYLADTYEGIPYAGEQDNYHTVGMFSDAKVEDVISIFSGCENVEILKGIFPDSFTEELKDEMFAVVHLDCDVYKSYIDSLAFLYPRTLPGGLIMLDDYNVGTAKGATQACDEFLSDKPEKIKELDGQYYFIKE
jgi:O-methyltransferase